MTFSTATSYVAPWHWDGWRFRGQVSVPRLDFIAGRIDLKILLSTIPRDIYRDMQYAVAKNGGMWQYSLDDSLENDAFEVLLKGAAESAKLRCARCGEKSTRA